MKSFRGMLCVSRGCCLFSCRALGPPVHRNQTVQDRTVVAQVDDRSKAPPVSPGDAERTVALLLVAPEITWLSELAGKDIAINEAASASNDEARRWLAAMVNAELAGGRTKALDRLVKGEVSAAVLSAVLSGDGRVVFRNRRFQGVSNSAGASTRWRRDRCLRNAAASDNALARIPLSPPSSEARAGAVDHGGTRPAPERCGSRCGSRLSSQST